MSGTDNGNQGNEDRAINMLMRRASRNRILPKKPPPIEVPIEAAPFEGKAVMQPFCVRIIVAAQMLGVGRTKIYTLIKRGELRTIKLDGSVLITMTSLEAFVERYANGGPSGSR
jgi:excisionase family DNA binding protein